MWRTCRLGTCHSSNSTPRPIPAVAFIAIVRHPPPSAMPTYSPKVMSDAELIDVWAFLKSIPEPPPVKDIPLLNQ